MATAGEVGGHQRCRWCFCGWLFGRLGQGKGHGGAFSGKLVGYRRVKGSCGLLVGVSWSFFGDFGSFFFLGYDIWPTFDVTNWRVRDHKPCGHLKCPQPMGFGFSECYPPSLHLHFNSIYSGQNILLGINISIHIPYSRHFCVDDFFFSPDGIC